MEMLDNINAVLMVVAGILLLALPLLCEPFASNDASEVQVKGCLLQPFIYGIKRALESPIFQREESLMNSFPPPLQIFKMAVAFDDCFDCDKHQ